MFFFPLETKNKKCQLLWCFINVRFNHLTRFYDLTVFSFLIFSQSEPAACTSRAKGIEKLRSSGSCNRCKGRETFLLGKWFIICKHARNVSALCKCSLTDEELVVNLVCIKKDWLQRGARKNYGPIRALFRACKGCAEDSWF